MPPPENRPIPKAGDWLITKTDHQSAYVPDRCQHVSNLSVTVSQVQDVVVEGGQCTVTFDRSRMFELPYPTQCSAKLLAKGLRSLADKIERVSDGSNVYPY